MTYPPGTTIHNPVTREWGRLLRVDEREMVAELICGPGGGVALPHRHPRIRETFDVLAGRLDVELDGVLRSFGPGERAVVEPGVAHWWTAAGDEDLHARLTVSPPGLFMQMIGAVWGLCVAGRALPDGAPRPADGILIAEAFGDTMVPVSPPRAVQRALVAVAAPVIRATGRRVDGAELAAACIVDPALWPGATMRGREPELAAG